LNKPKLVTKELKLEIKRLEKKRRLAIVDFKTKRR